MKVEIKIDPQAHEPRVLIVTDRVTEELAAFATRLGDVSRPGLLAGYSGSIVTLLDPEEIIRIYGANQKVFAQTNQGEFQLRARLYELEERLDPAAFIRISHSEIIALKKIRRLDLSLSGTILIQLDGKISTSVSRRYMNKIKQILGI